VLLRKQTILSGHLSKDYTASFVCTQTLLSRGIMSEFIHKRVIRSWRRHWQQNLDRFPFPPNSDRQKERDVSLDRGQTYLTFYNLQENVMCYDLLRPRSLTSDHHRCAVTACTNNPTSRSVTYMHYTVFGTQPVIRELRSGQWSSSLRRELHQYTACHSWLSSVFVGPADATYF
jgi:hypothetical protein